MPNWAGALAIRRWRKQPALLALVLAVAVIAGSVLCGSLLLIRSTEQAGVRGALASVPADRVDVVVRVARPPRPVADTRTAIDDAAARAYGSAARWSSTGWVTTDWSTTPSGVYSYLVEFDNPSSEGTLVDGVWPSAAPGIALPQSAAQALGLRVGDALTLGAGAGSLSLRVDGIYTAVPETGTFWPNDPLLAGGDADPFPEPGTSYPRPVHAIGPLIAAPGGIDASGLAPAQLALVEHPSFGSTSVGGLTSLRERATDVERTIASSLSHPQGVIFVDTDLTSVLDDVERGLATTRSAAAIIALLMLTVLAVAAAAITRLLADAHAAESAMLVARGASRSQVWWPVGVDALAIATLVAILSPWGGVLLHALIVGTPVLSSATLPRWILPDAGEWLCAITVAVVVGALVCRPSASRQRKAGNVLAGAAGAALVVVAVLLVWRLSIVNSVRGDLLFALTPAILVGAVSVVGARLVNAAARPAAAAASRTRGAVAPLAGWFAARGAGRSTGIVLVALTVGVSVVALGASATWQGALQNEAAVALGAPARIAVDARYPPALAGGSPVIRRQSLVSKRVPEGAEGDGPSASVQILGLDAAARGMLVDPTGAAVVAMAGGGTIRDELPRSDPADTGPLLALSTSRVRVRAEMNAPDGVEATIAAVLEDSSGAITRLALGELTTPAAAITLTSSKGAVPAHSKPLRLVALTVSLRGGESDHPASIAVTVDQISTLTSDPAAAVPVAMASAAEWAGFNDGDAKAPPRLDVTGSGIRLTMAAQLGSAPTTYGGVGWNPTSPIQAILPRALADELDVLSGAEITGFMVGAPVALRVAGTADAVPGAATAADLRSLTAGLPSSWRGTSTIVVDGRALVHRLVQSAAYGPLVDERWLSTTAPVSAIAAASRSAAKTTDEQVAYIDATTLADSMMRSPLRAEIPVSSVVVVWACVLLGLTGFGARAAAVSRSRRLEAAQLRAIGLSRRGMVGLVTLDTLGVALSGIVIGLVAGWTTLALIGTRIVGVDSAAAFDLVVPWQALILLPLALVAALGVVSFSVAVGQRRLPLPDLLRGGDGA